MGRLPIRPFRSPTDVKKNSLPLFPCRNRLAASTSVNVLCVWNFVNLSMYGCVLPLWRGVIRAEIAIAIYFNGHIFPVRCARESCWIASRSFLFWLRNAHHLHKTRERVDLANGTLMGIWPLTLVNCCGRRWRLMVEMDSDVDLVFPGSADGRWTISLSLDNLLNNVFYF